MLSIDEGHFRIRRALIISVVLTAGVSSLEHKLNI